MWPQVIHNTHSVEKRDGRNIYAIMKSNVPSRLSPQ